MLTKYAVVSLLNVYKICSGFLAKCLQNMFWCFFTKRLQNIWWLLSQMFTKYAVASLPNVYTVCSGLFAKYSQIIYFHSLPPFYTVWTALGFFLNVHKILIILQSQSSTNMCRLIHQNMNPASPKWQPRHYTSMILAGYSPV